MAHVTDFKEAGFNTLLEELEWRGLISQSTDRDRLAEALNGEPITYYCGFDPTAASLHIGNLVQLINMRHLQLAGHHPIALVGGATGLIGDPRQSGERTLNPKDVVAGWADRLKNQIGGILDTEGANAVRFVSNYDWTASMTVIDFLRDVGKNFRLGTMLAKDTVARRLNSEEGISFTEFSYQVLQGNDFLHLFDEYHCTLELGGSDQRFNLLVGRELQRQYNQKAQCIITMPLLVGLDGVNKMSKSKHNYIGITEEPNEMFGKVMSLSDDLMWNWFDLLSMRSNEEIQQLKKECEAGRNPRDAKVMLAKEIVTRFHNAEAADAAEQEFINRFRKGAVPENIPEVTLENNGEAMGILKLIKEAGLAPSTTEAGRNVTQGGVHLNGEKVTDKALQVQPGTYTLQVGKRKWAKVTLK